MKKKRLKWLRFFENEKEETEKSEELEAWNNLTILEKIKFFLNNFKYQSGQYKFVWIIRIALWILLGAIAIFGVVIKIIGFFK